jgi:predicted lipoprotein with Yx(FWY)xxD motif
LLLPLVRRPLSVLRDRRLALAPLTAVLGALVIGALVIGALVAGCTSTNTATRDKASYTIGVRRLRDLGQVLVGSRGMTLYIYTPDHQGHSTCTGLCSVQWPPLLVPGTQDRVVTGPGVERALVGTVRRANGSLQVTYHKWPLYTYRLDKFPGEATGEEDDMGLWQVISPGGQPIS